MTVTIADVALAVEIFIVMVALSAVVTYILREVQRLREQLDSFESELIEHDKETVTMGENND